MSEKQHEYILKTAEKGLWKGKRILSKKLRMAETICK